MASGDWVPTRPSDGWSGSRREAQDGQETSWSAVAHAIQEPPPATVSRPDDEPFVYNLLLLVSWLPRDAALFEALHQYHTSGFARSVLATGSGRSALQLRRALCNQQTDTRLKDYWLSLLKEPDADSPWDTVRRSELLETWRGILWLPRPSDSGPPLDLAAMDTGLRLLAGTTAGHREAATILRTALRRMVDAIPLDPATWVELIAPFWSDWPELLRDLAVEHWPALEPRPLAVLPRLPADLAELWEAFDADTRGDILGALNSGDSEAGRRLVNNLVFSPPRMSGLSPQEVGRRIIDLSHVLWPTAEAQPPVEALYDDRDWQKERERTKGGTKGIDRHAALESVNRGLAAEQQYRANIARWPNDGVAHHGLANVLRKQQRHAEALQLLPNPLRPVTARDLYDLHLRGMILLELGRWDEALDAFERGLEATNASAQQAAFRRGLVLMDLSRRDPEAAQQKLRDLPEDVLQLNVYRLHAAAGRKDEAQVRTLQSRLDADVVRMDFTTRAALRKLEAAYCLKGRAGICEPDEAAYRAVIDAEIEMEQAA